MEKSKIKIAVGSDHAGFDMKEFVKNKLNNNKNYLVTDFGTDSNEAVDYPDYAHLVAKSIENKDCDIAIIICGSGNGVNITVNKYPNVRSALCWNSQIAKLARLHNDANILALPARFIDLQEAENIINTFLNTEFEGGRHKRRVNKICPR